MKKAMLLSSVAGLCLGAGIDRAGAEEITVATVNNGDMITMQELSSQWEEDTGNTINWVVLEENTLRSRVTNDIANGGGQYDVLTIGNYEVPIWAQQDWLLPLENLPEDYDQDDLLPAIAEGLTVDGQLYAVPFYGESAMVMYRSDLAQEAGVEIPDEPTWADISAAAEAMHDPDGGAYGICLRGKAGWGENMALITAMSNSYGARWFDMDWAPQFDSPEWRATVEDYLDLMSSYGPPGAATNGFNENLSLFQQGRCAIWIDATVAAGFVTDPDDSTVADSVAFAQFPHAEGVDNTGNWLWSWNLAIPASSEKAEVAQDFIAWATSRDYIELVAEEDGWGSVPPGTRTSTYENPDYIEAAPFADRVLTQINAATPASPSVQETPYTGAQFVAIPEFQGVGTAVGQTFSAALAGQMDLDQALQSAQSQTERMVRR